MITNGFGAMPDHAAQVQVRDRWAIVAYMRALQASARASITTSPAAERGRTGGEPVMRLDLNPDRLIPELARYQRQLLIAGAAGAAVSLVGLLLDRRQFFQSYLMAFMLLLGATLGSLALGMIHQLSGGAWGVVTRRIFGAASRVLPVLTLLFVPLLFGLHDLYEWTRHDVVAADPILSANRLYLNTPFFLVRTAFYFGVWNAIAYFLNRWSLEQDRSPDPRIAQRMQMISGGGSCDRRVFRQILARTDQARQRLGRALDRRSRRRVWDRRLSRRRSG